MDSTTIRVSKKVHEMLQALAHDVDLPMQEVVEQALEAYRRQRLLAATNEAYAALRRDAQAWQSWTSEQGAWDATLADGLEQK